MINNNPFSICRNKVSICIFPLSAMFIRSREGFYLLCFSGNTAEEIVKKTHNKISEMSAWIVGWKSIFEISK